MTLIHHLKQIVFDEHGNARVKTDVVTSSGFSLEEVVVDVLPIGMPVLGQQVPSVFYIEDDKNVDAVEVYSTNIPKEANGYAMAKSQAEIVEGRRYIEIEANNTQVSADDPHETPLMPKFYYRPIQFYRILGRKNTRK